LARLELLDEDGHRSTVPLEATGATLGRARDNTVPFPKSERVSRYHAEIVHQNGEHVLVDRGSRGGTLVNDVVVWEHPLVDGDVIQLGPSPSPTLTFRVEDPEVAPEVDTEGLEEEPGTRTNADNDEAMTLFRAEDTRFLNPALLAQATSTARGNQKLTARVKALYELSSTMLAVSSVEELATRLLDSVFDVVPADRSAVLLGRTRTGDLIPRATKTRSGKADDTFSPSRTITRRVLLENVAVLSMDATVDDRFASGSSVLMQSVRSVICAPVSTKRRVWGVCYLDTVIARKQFDEEELEFLVAAARQAGMAMENLSLIQEQKKTFESLIRTLAYSIDARDQITAGHSSRVAKYAEAICRYLGLSALDRKRIWYAALLHDYGKIGTREAVLCKPGKLDPEEIQHIQEHARHTLNILSKINFSAEMRDLPKMAASHHERPDGTGYPLKLKGDEIPLGGRVIAVADVFDALTARRHYREPMPLDQVLEVLNKGRGTQFDPRCVDAFLTYFYKEYMPLQQRAQEVRGASPGQGEDQRGRPAEATVIKPAPRRPGFKDGGVTVVKIPLKPKGG
jgi:putative nucleotidyltransferase with HDIG domain